jgi:UDP-glucose 4-epimerase
MKTLVTGGAGFIGSHLVKALVARDYNVCVLDNLSRGKKEFIKTFLSNGQVEFIKGDVRDIEIVQKAMEGVKVVFHLAAQSSVLGAVSNIEYSFSTNVTGTFNVLRSASAAGVRRVVFTSSREVYGEALQLPVDESQPLRAKNAYGASKIACEAYCNVFMDSLFEVPILRLANVYGTRDRNRVIPIFIGQALQGQPLTLFGGEQVIDFIWIGQVVQVLLEAGFRADWPVDEPVNVGSGVGTSIRDLAEKILQLTQAQVKINVAAPRAPEVVHFVADNSRMRALMRLSNSTNPLNNLPEVINYWRTNVVHESDRSPQKAPSKI